MMLKEPSAFLEHARPFPSVNKFVVGTFERGVTLFRQQIRALNLVYSFVEARDSVGQRVVPKGARIAVIGGGAFGVMAAAAAAYAEFDVLLLERHQALLHLQQGCDTRWIHPRFYDWPAPEADSRLARLPFLDWAASTAGQVAVEIGRQFTQIADRFGPKLHCVLGASDIVVAKADGGYEVRYRALSEQGSPFRDVIIYAVGFGHETGPTASYWRNDPYAQSNLSFTGERIQHAISGFGDGALVDLFRLTLHDFRYERIFDEMFGSLDSSARAVLVTIASERNPASGALFDRFEALERGVFASAIERAKDVLQRRRRSDTAVTLNGTEESFRVGLSMERISFSNALLAYLLFRLDAFKYEHGRIDFSDAKKPVVHRGAETTTAPEWLKGVVIRRHGTNPGSVLTDGIGCTGAQQVLEERASQDTGQPIFPAGWWGRYTVPDAVGTRAEPTPVEYVPPVLMTHAMTFVSTLASALRHWMDQRRGGGEQQFRVALHRLTRFDGVEVFQQVTPYDGRVERTAGAGRFFPVNSGIVGLACRTGKVLVARKRNKKNFQKIWELTELDRSGAKEIKPYVDSLLCCPFFFPNVDPDTQRVAMALFVDSAHAAFFEDPNVLGTIFSACYGFVSLLESLHRNGALRPVPGADFQSGYQTQRSDELDALVVKLQKLGVTFADLGTWKESLTFNSLKSVDFEVASSVIQSAAQATTRAPALRPSGSRKPRKRSTKRRPKAKH